MPARRILTALPAQDPSGEARPWPPAQPRRPPRARSRRGVEHDRSASRVGGPRPCARSQQPAESSSWQSGRPSFCVDRVRTPAGPPPERARTQGLLRARAQETWPPPRTPRSEGSRENQTLCNARRSRPRRKRSHRFPMRPRLPRPASRPELPRSPPRPPHPSPHRDASLRPSAAARPAHSPRRPRPRLLLRRPRPRLHRRPPHRRRRR